MNRIDKLLQLAMKKQGVTSYNALAIKLGLNREHVSKWKLGKNKPGVENFAKLAHAAGISLDDALPYVVDEERETRQCILCKVKAPNDEARFNRAFLSPMIHAPPTTTRHAMKHNPFDLFGQIPVLIPELYEYVQRYAPRIVQSGWRIENYIKAYNVPEKVRQMKLSGTWNDPNEPPG